MARRCGKNKLLQATDKVPDIWYTRESLKMKKKTLGVENESLVRGFIDYIALLLILVLRWLDRIFE